MLEDESYFMVSKNKFGKGRKAINPLASPCEGAPALKYGDVNTETPFPSEVKGLMMKQLEIITNILRIIL